MKRKILITLIAIFAIILIYILTDIGFFDLDGVISALSLIALIIVLWFLYSVFSKAKDIICRDKETSRKRTIGNFVTELFREVFTFSGLIEGIDEARAMSENMKLSFDKRMVAKTFADSTNLGIILIKNRLRKANEEGHSQALTDFNYIFHVENKNKKWGTMDKAMNIIFFLHNIQMNAVNMPTVGNLPYKTYLKVFLELTGYNPNDPILMEMINTDKKNFIDSLAIQCLNGTIQQGKQNTPIVSEEAIQAVKKYYVIQEQFTNALVNAGYLDPNKRLSFNFPKYTFSFIGQNKSLDDPYKNLKWSDRPYFLVSQIQSATDKSIWTNPKAILTYLSRVYSCLKRDEAIREIYKSTNVWKSINISGFWQDSITEEQDYYINGYRFVGVTPDGKYVKNKTMYLIPGGLHYALQDLPHNRH
jgi:hypothetical protein